METKGWSSQPPARSMRNGMVITVRSAVVERAVRPGVRGTVQDQVFYAVFFAQLALGQQVAVFVDNQEIGLDFLEFFEKVQHPRTTRDKGLFHTAQRLDHVQPFIFVVDRDAPFQVVYGFV